MRNPLHSICPYFAMFPEAFVQKQLLAYSRPGDLVLDPFCGRGTTILEALLNGRQAIGCDINSVAACVAGAKANVPSLEHLQRRVSDLEEEFFHSSNEELPRGEFFELCFNNETLRQLIFLRNSLQWKADNIDQFLAATLLGVLHGESHKTELCLSNRMPRTISTKPDYSVRWWKARGLVAPRRDVFGVLRRSLEFRCTGAVPAEKGRVVQCDARLAHSALHEFKHRVSLVITSPPYLDTTDYAEDQWLRLWFLGGPERPSPRLNKDDRHTKSVEYWAFLAEVWQGCSALLAKESVIVIRIGGSSFRKEELFKGILNSFGSGLSHCRVEPIHSGETSQIKKRQTNAFRPGTSDEKVEHDFAFRLSF